MCVYIPNRPLLFKMMKACIGVKRIQDLWMYSESLHSDLAMEKPVFDLNLKVVDLQCGHNRGSHHDADADQAEHI